MACGMAGNLNPSGWVASLFESHMEGPEMNRLVWLLAALAACVPDPAWAGFLGNTVNIQVRSPDIGTVSHDFGNYVVGSGIERLDIPAFDLTDTTISIFSLGPIQFGSTAFSGYSFTDAFGTIPAITNVSVDSRTNLPGFSGSRVTFNADQVFVNLSGLFMDSDPRQQVVLDVSFATAAAPEPATIVSLATGATVLIGYGWRRKGTGSTRTGR
jgi:hypothetical protein